MIVFYSAIGLVFLCMVLFETAFRNVKHRRLLESLFCTTIVFILLALKKETVGRDGTAYKAAFEWASTIGWEKLSSNYSSFEISFKFLMKLFSSMKMPYVVFAAFIYLGLCSSLFFLFYQYCDIPGMAWLFFLCFGSFTFVTSALRQGLAISLTIFSFLVFKKEKWWTWLIGIALIAGAYMFHHSAIAFVLVLPGLFLKIRRNDFILFAIACIAVAIFAYPVLSFFYYDFTIVGRYTKSYNIFFEAGLGGSLVSIIAIVAIYFAFQPYRQTAVAINERFPHWRLVERIPEPVDRPASKNNDSFFLFASELVVLVLIVSCYFNMAARIADYFRIYLGLVLINTITKQSNKTIRNLALIALPILLSLYLYFTTFRGNYLNLLPYRFFWQ